MLARLIFILLILAVVAIPLLRWFTRTPPEQVARVLRWTVVIGLVGMFLVLAVTGRLHWLFALIASLMSALAPVGRRALPWLLRFFPLLRVLGARYRTARAARGPTPGHTSEVRSRFLRMVLDHDTGEMDGEVLEGRFTGRYLRELDLDDLAALFDACRAQDEDSAALLEAYLERVHGDTWRERYQTQDEASEARAEGTGGPMSRDEAYAILGLQSGASAEEIVSAHRRLMQKLHPDRGGSTYLAAKINQAKDLLLAD